jgi:hypothetical protein
MVKASVGLMDPATPNSELAATDGSQLAVPE